MTTAEIKLTTNPVQHTTPVAEFHAAFGHPIETAPTVPSLAQRLLRVKMLAEELAEFAEAAGIVLTIEQRPLQPLAMGHHETVVAVREARHAEVDLVECADGLTDLRYLVDGGNLIFGFDGDALLAEVHRSNMSKLGADGLPVRRDDGKTLKGPNYSPPNIASVLMQSLTVTAASPGAVTAQPALQRTAEISDREWAAKPANLREGCTTHVQGVGDI